MPDPNVAKTPPKQSQRSTHWSRTSPKRSWDAIVIGSGMGGMTTAAMLSKLGQRVLVLEQHYVPGGFTHTFKRKGYEWDVGVHAVGEVTQHSLTGRLLSYLTGGELEWASLGEVIEEFHWPDGFRIDFPDTPEQFRANLVAAFPKEEAAIDAYMDMVRKVAAGMRGYYLSRVVPSILRPLAEWTIGRKAQRFLEMRTADVVNGMTDDPKLRALFCAQWGYYGSPPSRSSFAIQALVVKHYRWGAYYPVGGSAQIARGLLKTVAEAGGWTRICADVEEILCVGGRAIGVRLKDGEVIHANTVMSAVGILSTAKRLLPAGMRDAKWITDLERLRPAPAHVCLYIGFKGDIRKAGASAANKWFCRTWDMDEEAWEVEDPEKIGDAGFLYCSFPSLKDPLHDPGPEQRHTGEVVTFVPWKTFERWKDTRWRRRGEDYESLKQAIQDSLLEQLLRNMPELREYVDYVEVSTPLSTDHFCRPVAGSIYGIEPTPERFRCPWLKPRSPIKNLFFSGSEVATVGVIGAMMGGVLCAAAASPLKAIGLLRKT